jgi:hypothetical protein
MIDACLLLTPEEVETVLGNKVVSEVIYPTGMTGCRYISDINGEIDLAVFVMTDTTIRQDKYLESINVKTAKEQYEMLKSANLRFAEKTSGIFKVYDIDNLGDFAYIQTGDLHILHVLKNYIYYEFSSLVGGDIGRDGLVELARR